MFCWFEKTKNKQKKRWEGPVSNSKLMNGNKWIEISEC